MSHPEATRGLRAERTYEALDALRDALPDLDEALTPGTPRRWSQRDLTPERRAKLDALARLEREDKQANLARGLKTLGTGRAPLRIDVLDTAVDITHAVAELEDAVCDRLGQTPLAGATTAQRITRLVGLLDRIAEQRDLAEHVEVEAHRLAQRARLALGDVEPVNPLDARCPICDAMSLRAFPERDVVVCINPDCRCDQDDCPCHRPRPRRHRWPATEWEWLAQVLAGGLGESS